MSLRDELIVALHHVPSLDLVFSDEYAALADAHDGRPDADGMTPATRWLEGHSADAVIEVLRQHGIEVK